MPLYFIAIVAPENINREILQFKNYMLAHFGCKVALRSPAHITLVPPFHMHNSHENELLNTIKKFGSTLHEFDVRLKDFNCFKPRVIYVDVVMTEILLKTKKAFEDFLLSEGWPIKRETRPFHPHVTIANRDLEKKDFTEAWDHFKNLRYDATFNVNGIDLLQSERAGWRVVPRISQSPSFE